MEFNEDLVQFYPNRITVSRPVVQSPDHHLHKMVGKWFYKWGKKLADDHGLDYVPLNPIEKKDFKQWVSLYQNIYSPAEKSSVNLSASSKRNIRDSIFAMYQLSKPRTVTSPGGKFIYNFRQSFVTLTLPSKQMHSDVEIKKCLNHFLTNVRRAFKVQNYVWKAELQKNENIHFHLSFDKYIHFQAIRYYWLLAIGPLGYVDAYASKFSTMSIGDYAKLRGSTVPEVTDAYMQGVRSKWRSPNCVDVKAVTTANSVSNYLSKYFAKNDDSNIDSDRIKAFGKVWARSQSLAKLQWKNKFTYSEIREFIAQLLKMGAVKRIAYDFSTVYYFNFKKLVGIHKTWFEKLLFCNGRKYNYPFPVP